MSVSDAPLAFTRFGIGARPGERTAAAGDPRGMLKQQLAQKEAALVQDPELPSSDMAVRSLAQARLTRRAAKRAGRTTATAASTADVTTVRDALSSLDPGLIRRTVYRAEVEARVAHGATTDAGFVERLVLFWTNHFAVSVDKGPVHVMAGAFEREAIRPHVLGRFADLLKAVERHPAMLVFLDNVRSVGPNSTAGQRRGLGLNENLARETLELHTLGADGGFSQADVTNFARILTGWGWVRPGADRKDAGRFAFFPARHEPGAIPIVGKVYPEGGLEQGEAVLEDLARHPATARHLARKLATHFICDDPPDGAVGRIEAAYRQSDGDLGAVAAAIVDAPEAWDPTLRKIKTPYEFVLSAARIAPGIARQGPFLLRSLAVLGQRTFAPPSPKGWPDEAAAWLAPHSFKERVDWAALVAGRNPPASNPASLADDVFGGMLSSQTRLEIARAETGAQGLAILLMSPEFQRR